MHSVFIDPHFCVAMLTFFPIFPKAIIWIKEPQIYEAAVNGTRQGITRTSINTPKARYRKLLLIFVIK
jgi:hypothetical protein